MYENGRLVHDYSRKSIEELSMQDYDSFCYINITAFHSEEVNTAFKFIAFTVCAYPLKPVLPGLGNLIDKS